MRNNRTALNLSPSKPARSLQKKKYGDAFENDFRAPLGVLMKIHSRFIARPLNRFTHVESIQPGFQVLSNGHEAIQRTRFSGFKFNRRRPVEVCFHPRPTNKGSPQLFPFIAQVTPRPNRLVHLRSDGPMMWKISHRYESDTKLWRRRWTS